MSFKIGCLRKAGVLSLLLIFLGAGFVFSMENQEKNTLEVAGVVMLGKDVTDGNAAAVSSSLVTAVSMVVSELLPNDTIARNFHILNQNLYTRTSDYIQGYKVLTRSRSRNQYMVLVRVTVQRERVVETLEKLGLMTGEESYPKVLIMLFEKTVEDDLPQYWWGEDLVFVQSVAETTISEKLAKKGFIIVKHGDLKAPLNLAMKIGDPMAVELGKKFGVEIVVTGSAVAGISANTMGEDLKTFTGEIKARAIAVNTGEVMASATAQSTATSDDPFFGGKEALAGAGMRAGDMLAAQIQEVLNRENARSARIEMLVEGTGGNIADFVRFRTALNDLPGVNEIKIKEMTPDTAILSIDFQGSARDLADALVLKTFVTFGINIFDVTDGRIGVRIVDR